MSDRTAEIWSTRLQRELLALTTPDPESDSSSAAEKDKADDESQATPKHDNVSISSLPPFIKIKEHQMDIASGICKITFSIDVEKQVTAQKSESAGDTGSSGMGEEAEDTKIVPEENKGCVLVTLDASMEDVQNSNPVCYPFQKPRVILTEGAVVFPPNSSIQNGDFIDLDCDWTPSLHLSDAALNVALKIRESIRRGDPFRSKQSSSDAAGEDLAENANAAAVTSFLTGTKNFSLPSMSSMTSMKKKPKDIPKKKPKNPSHVKIGDIIDLSIPPYSVCAGMFSCKAIRRPQFVEQAIAEATAREEAEKAATLNTRLDDIEGDENEIPSGAGNYMRLQAGGIRKVAGAGFVGAGSFFKSIAQSAKAALEESFLMITQDHILELRSSKFSIDSATVTFISPISLLAKLKFRREESISLFFKQAPDDPLILMCPESAEAVQQIQSVLKRHGVKGKHTNSATQRQIQLALQLVMDIQAKESKLEENPSVDKVNDIMDLYRQAAEKFEIAGDARHEEVMSHMHKFLAKPLTLAVLDGSYKPSSGASPTIVAVPPKNEDDGLSNEEPNSTPNDNRTKSPEKQPTKAVDKGYEDTMKQADDILNEVENFNMGGEEDLDDFLSSAATSGGSRAQEDNDHDPVAELDAMLSAADKELNDIIDGN